MPVARNIFVLSGGGSRGAGQVGMLRALWAAGVTPDLLVGGSVGAINACFVGSHPDAAGVENLAASWLGVSEEALCGRRRGVVVNVARRRPYLFSSDRLRRLVSEWVPTYHLENLAIPVRVATTDLATGSARAPRPRLHPRPGRRLGRAPGDLPAGRAPGARRSRDPRRRGGRRERALSGAADVAGPGDRVWVLDVTRTASTTRTLRNPLDVLIASLAASVRNRDEPTFHPDAEVVRCKLDESFDCGPVFDFSHTAELIQLGEEAAATALEAASSPSPSLFPSVAASVAPSIRVAGRRARGLTRSPVHPEPVGQRVPQQHHVADPAHLREGGPPVGVPREAAVADEPAGAGVAHEERRDDQVQLVGEVGGEELGVHGPAALDHQPAHAAGVQVLARPVACRTGCAAVDDGGHRARAGRGRRRTAALGAVDQLLGVAGGEEVRARRPAPRAR